MPPHIVHLDLKDDARKVYDVFAHAEKFDGDDLRTRTGMNDKQLNRAMALLGTELRRATGRKFDTYFERTRVNKNGRRVKVYARTVAGARLIRELQVA